MTPFGNYTRRKAVHVAARYSGRLPAWINLCHPWRILLRYIIDWEGDERFCIVHTTHEIRPDGSRRWVEKKPAMSQLENDGVGDSFLGSDDNQDPVAPTGGRHCKRKRSAAASNASSKRAKQKSKSVITPRSAHLKLWRSQHQRLMMLPG